MQYTLWIKAFYSGNSEIFKYLIPNNFIFYYFELHTYCLIKSITKMPVLFDKSLNYKKYLTQMLPDFKINILKTSNKQPNKLLILIILNS